MRVNATYSRLNKAKADFVAVASAMTAADLNQQDPSTGQTGLHLAVQRGVLKDLPAHLVTEIGLAIGDKNGRTPLHDLKTNWSSIPKSALTEAVLLKENAYGEIPLHLAACAGNLNLVPSRILTLDNLLLEDQDGWNSLRYAEKHGNLKQIPALQQQSILKMSPEEKKSWFVALTAFMDKSSELCLALGADMSHCEQKGAWQEL